MKCLLIIFLGLTVFGQAHASGWGSFNGNNLNGDAICLIVNSTAPNKNNKDIQDLIASVQVPGISQGTAKWLPEICHRQLNNPSEIWCDGNKNSPMFGVTYRLKKTVGSSKTEESERQYWECSKGCNSNTPQQLLYER